MFDLKTCFLDLLRVQVSPRPKKTLKEFSNRYSSNFMKKYNDINIIHFNENMSMQSRNGTMKFAPTYRGGFFQTNPMTDSFPGRKKSAAPTATATAIVDRELGVETVCYDFSSDDRLTDACPSTSDDGETGVNDFSDARATANSMDSFCTLCTSSFSFNNCNKCEGSSCSSKCSVVSSCYCCNDRSVER